MTGALSKLADERREWRKDPLFGFVAKPSKNADGSLNLLIWDCYIPGKIYTPWQGGMYYVRMKFSYDYPSNPPKCKFVPPLFHPNVSSSGTMCLPALYNSEETMSIKNMLTCLQHFIHKPDFKNCIREDVYHVYKNNSADYLLRIKEHAKKTNVDYYKPKARN